MKGAAGFTLIEMVVALTITALIMVSGHQLLGEVANLSERLPAKVRADVAATAFPMIVARQYAEAGKQVAAGGDDWWVFTNIQARLPYRDLEGSVWPRRDDKEKPKPIAARYRLADGALIYEEFEDENWRGKKPRAALVWRRGLPRGAKLFWLLEGNWTPMVSSEPFGPVRGACWGVNLQTLRDCW